MSVFPEALDARSHDALPFALMAKMICDRCGTIGRPKKERQGSFAVELVLWLLFCLPGLVYSVWRLSASFVSCRSCGGAVIALDSPRGRQLVAYFHPGQLPPH
jgi:hypothetical protein